MQAPERGTALQQLVQRVPQNLTAQLMWAGFAASTGKLSEARTALDRAVMLAGALPHGADTYLAAARAALQRGDAPGAAGSIQTLENLLRPTPRQLADRNALD